MAKQPNRAAAGTSATKVGKKSAAKPGRKTASKARKTAKPRRSAAKAAVSAEERERMIAEAAYFKAEHRGFAGDTREEDWHQAAAEIDEMLAPRRGKKG